MLFQTYFFAAALIATVDASPHESPRDKTAFSTVKRVIYDRLWRRQDCPSVWFDIGKQLASEYVTNGQCNSDARGAIRLAFHDCFSGGCDGSMILANDCSRKENAGLQDTCQKIGDLAKEKDVGVADLIQFAGAAGIKACPGGVSMPIYIGRKDSTTPAPEGEIPSHLADADTLINQFAAKGFTTTDLVALVGAHSTSQQKTVDTARAGAAQDSTDGIWDVKFYSETLDGSAPFSFPSDKNIAENSQCSGDWKRFSRSSAGWNRAFFSAMEKMSLLGNDKSELMDCSAALDPSDRRRTIQSASRNARFV
ncbi:heme peroxidase [Pseudovirgaria hyperparasitica]|uniref:Peroxidase n=1 Tax=Pseudovirgaria hyperparasitica TaxID=470096 RepID=A0A6A6WGT9_9PEZI|nr:heme peroxidase [Pseudovirgaria hyperparasitica]KAF2761429.1 heme peroxidase [Pseudovirgaria hyperparasitica]